MKKLTTALVAGALALATVGVAPVAAGRPDSTPGARPDAGPPDRLPPSAQADAGSVPGSWIVERTGGIGADSADSLAERYDGEVGLRFDRAIDGFQFLGTPEEADRLAEDPDVASVIPDRPVHTDVEVVPTGYTRVDGAAATAAVGGVSSAGAGATIGILDTGIDLDHPDLAANLHPTLGVNCLTPGGSPDDDNIHGTHVAGTAAAIGGNDTGVIGIASAATLVPIKVLDDNGDGTFASVICGVDYAVANAGAIDVINMSLSGTSFASDSCTDGGLREAICTAKAAGITVVVSAGNLSRDAAIDVPARYPEAITVSALDDRDGTPASDTFAAFSNFGSVVDIIAPGVLIRSTAPGGGLATLSGTSMAAPHVAGLAALLIAEDPSLTPDDIQSLLRTTGECPDGTVAGADDSCAGQGTWSGDGDAITEPLIDALAAVSSLAPPSATCSGMAATIVGTSGPDTLVGTPGPDVIAGLGGDDTIEGLDGDDTICGGDGDDTIDGGAGNDTIIGNDGDDTIEGGPGDDAINGAGGSDTVSHEASATAVTVDLAAGTSTGEGTDTLVAVENATGSAHADQLTGNGLANVLRGLGDADLLEGSGGDDLLRGDGGPDKLVGGPGNDHMIGGGGNDDLRGGSGDDLHDGGPGQDVANYVVSTGPIVADLSTGSATGDGTDTFVAIEDITGTNADDVLIGDSGPNKLRGRLGNDTLIGGGGDDLLKASGGDDSLDGGPGDDDLRGGSGDDDLTGGDDDDSLNGGSGANDACDGGAGTDVHAGGCESVVDIP